MTAIMDVRLKPGFGREPLHWREHGAGAMRDAPKADVAPQASPVAIAPVGTCRSAGPTVGVRRGAVDAAREQRLQSLRGNVVTMVSMSLLLWLGLAATAAVAGRALGLF